VQQHQITQGTLSMLGLAREADALRGSTHVVGRKPEMSSGTEARALRIGMTGFLGCSAAVLATMHSGRAAAAPAALGLTVLAATDLEERRLPSRIVSSTFAAILAAAVVDAERSGDWVRLAEAAAIACAVSLVALVIWASTSGIAFGDVKLLGVAAIVPALIAPRLVISMVFAALVASLIVVFVGWFRTRGTTRNASIAFGPPLLVGWLVAVMSS
jgi:Flp pilus assembly protein protease CpaA